jgi:hypothetical protein
MSKETEEASGFFAKATDILRAQPAATARIEPALANAKARIIREAAKLLCEALESGAQLGAIDEKAKTLGMEVLSVQSMTLQARKRSK